MLSTPWLAAHENILLMLIKIKSINLCYKLNIINNKKRQYHTTFILLLFVK
ncbi:hypothetical protein [Piscirickettsia salmonis]|uniref:hypothetical protein n=1 Tax=Piscirickettsia salmonis TaxID=1238 RepID=UPI000A8CF241|nr:hypothetical protein [Piscirickettsia salmonis]